MPPKSLSRRTLVGALAVALGAGGAFAWWRAASPDGHPTIQFDRTAHDFGVVRQRAEIPVEFRLMNGGGAPVHLKVRGDCGCAQPTLSADVVPPGGTAVIAVTLRTETLVGPHRKHVVVTSDDPDAPETRLALAFDVSAGILAKPPNFFFSQALVGSSPTAEVRLRWKEGVGRPFRVLGVDAKPQVAGAPPLGVVFDTAPFDEPPWHGVAVTMRFEKPPPLGMIAGTAVIRTDDPESAEVKALIGGHVTGKVVVPQRETSFGIVPEGKGATVPIYVSPFDATVNLETVTAKSRAGTLQVEVRKAPGATGAWIVDVSLPASAAPGAIDDVVEIRTAVPGEELVEVRVSGRVTPKKP